MHLEENIHDTVSSNEHAAYRETPKVPQSLQFTEHLRDRVSNTNITSLHSSLCCCPGYNHVFVKYWQWSWALSKSLDAHPTAALLSNHRRVAAFYNIHWSPKASEQTCLAESYVTTGERKKKKLESTKFRDQRKNRFPLFAFRLTAY